MTAKPTASLLVDALAVLSGATANAEAYVDASATLEPIDQAAAIALVQDLRKRLGQVEQDLAITLGKAEGQHQGNLPDGRQFTLKRTAERKAWEHEDWKRDARRQVVKSTLDRIILAATEMAGEPVPYVVDTETGEEVELASVLHRAITEAQEVHGSTAPRSTALKRLGLYASDYCESSPGGWKFDAIAPKPQTETDQEN